MEYARTQVGFADDIEITLEANPGTIERGRFAEYRAAGVTRVSLGAQSFDARQLKLLGRIHSADETRRAAEELHAAGLSNFNLDLMYALPGQPPEEAQADIDAALALQPAHLSQYHLTIEPGTLFAAAPPTQPADDIVDEMLERCCKRSRRRGSSSTRCPGTRARARMRSQSELLGVRRLPRHRRRRARQDSRLRPAASQSARSKLREPRRYLAADPRSLVRKSISIRDLPFEFAMNGFRLVRRIRRTSCSNPGPACQSRCWKEALASLVARGLVERGEKQWRATPKGFRFLNEILVELLPPTAESTANP